MKTGDLFIVMGVSGCGKSTMARRLAEATGGDWMDADDFHPAENKAKMAAGIPLTDEDRWPWYDRLRVELQARAGTERPFFLACSALKQKYREHLVAGFPLARFVYLKGTFELIQARLRQRTDHFMSARLLESQFATLEERRDAIVLDIAKTEEQLVEDFLRIVKAG